MSTTYVKQISAERAIQSPRIPRAAVGVGAALAGVAAVGAAVAIFLAPAAPKALPAMDASLGYHDFVDTRPAISLNVTRSYANLPTIGEAPEYADGRLLPTVSQLDVSLGYWDFIDTRPAISRHDASMGYWDFVHARPAVSSLPAMPRSMGHWDFTLKAEPTGLGFWDLIE